MSRLRAKPHNLISPLCSLQAHHLVACQSLTLWEAALCHQSLVHLRACHGRMLSGQDVKGQDVKCVHGSMHHVHMLVWSLSETLIFRGNALHNKVHDVARKELTYPEIHSISKHCSTILGILDG